MNATATESRLAALDAAALTPIARQTLDQPAATVTAWQYRQLGIPTGTATGGLYLFTGTARDGAAPPLPWAAVLKITERPAHGDGGMTDPQHGLYWKREALVYQSDLLADLPGGLRGPRCYAVWEQPDESAWLWLEQVTDRYGPVWPLAQFGRAARSLGRFNGAYLAGRPLPSDPWLRHNGTIVSAPGALEGTVRLDLIQDEATWAQPLVRAAFPTPVAGRLLGLWAARDRFRAVLARLPRTLCHLDAWRDNLFAPPGEDAERLVLIDWAGVGQEALGVDAGDLFGASFMHSRVTPAVPHALDALVFDRYVAGLRDTGWQGDVRLLRAGYAGYAALKYGMLLWWLPDVADPRRHARWEAQAGRPMAEFVAQQGALLTYLLSIAEEALQQLD